MPAAAPSRRSLLLAALGGALAGGASARDAAASPAPAGFVRIEGKRFLEADGRPLFLKGINLGNWLMPEGYMFKFEKQKSPKQIDAVLAHLVGRDGADAFWQAFRARYIAADDLRFIRSVGFNVVRLPMHHALFAEPEPPHRFTGEGWRLVDRLVGWARAEGLRVILDLHAAPGGQTGINHDDGPGFPMLFYVPAFQRRTLALWQEIARRYRDEPAVLGYDLLNEPITPYADVAYLNPRLEPFYRRLVEAIRVVDPHHPIFLAGAQWSGSFEMLGPPFAGNVAYTYHKFWSSTERDAVQPYLDFSNRYDVPVFLGESGELTDEWTRAFRLLNEKHGIGWCFWTYKNLDSSSTVASIRRPADWDAVAAVAALPRGGWAAATPPRAVAERALADYLDGLPVERTRINWSYLGALGLADRPPA